MRFLKLQPKVRDILKSLSVINDEKEVDQLPTENLQNLLIKL